MSDKKPKKKSQATKEKWVIRTLERDLPVTLTQNELLSRGDEISKLHAKAGELKLKKKVLTDEVNGEIKGVEGAISALVQQIRSRSETRSVLCEEVADARNAVVRVIRKDKGVAVETRALLQHERQPGLPGLMPIDGGKADKPEKAAKASKKDPKKDAKPEPAAASAAPASA